MSEKIKEVQRYLKKKGFEVAETTIADMAIDLARRLGADDWTFVCEVEMRKEKEERGEEESSNNA